MEPCLFRHGSFDRHAPALIVWALLQWSHVFSDMVREYSVYTPLIEIGATELRLSDMVSL